MQVVLSMTPVVTSERRFIDWTSALSPLLSNVPVSLA
jgi:hypothetical protein